MSFYCIKLTVTMSHRNKDALKESTSAFVKDRHTEYKTYVTADVSNVTYVTPDVSHVTPNVTCVTHDVLNVTPDASQVTPH